MVGGCSVLSLLRARLFCGGLGGRPEPILTPVPWKFLLEVGGGLSNFSSRNPACSWMVFVILEASLALRAVLGLKRKVGETRVIYMIGLPGTFVTFAVVLPAVCVFGLWTGLVLSISFGSASSAKRTRLASGEGVLARLRRELLRGGDGGDSVMVALPIADRGPFLTPSPMAARRPLMLIGRGITFRLGLLREAVMVLDVSETNDMRLSAILAMWVKLVGNNSV